MQINRLGAMGLLIELPTPQERKIAACAICLNRGSIISQAGSVKPCLCNLLNTHTS